MFILLSHHTHVLTVLQKQIKNSTGFMEAKTQPYPQLSCSMMVRGCWGVRVHIHPHSAPPPVQRGSNQLSSDLRFNDPSLRKLTPSKKKVAHHRAKWPILASCTHKRFGSGNVMLTRQGLCTYNDMSHALMRAVSVCSMARSTCPCYSLQAPDFSFLYSSS